MGICSRRERLHVKVGEFRYEQAMPTSSLLEQGVRSAVQTLRITSQGVYRQHWCHIATNSRCSEDSAIRTAVLLHSAAWW